MSRVCGALEILDEAEVEQLDDVVLAAAAQHDVLRLDVAMDQAALVRFAQRGADLPQDVDHAARRARGPECSTSSASVTPSRYSIT